MIPRLISLFAIALAISLIALVSLKYTSGDFDVYYHSSQSYLAKAPVYVAHDGIDEFKYSPLFTLLFSPLTLIKEKPALYIWTIFNILSLYGIFYLLYKLKQVSFSRPKDLLIFICLLALTGRFIFADFRLGQVNTLLCFLMVLTMYFEINKKYFKAGLVLAFSLMIKFFPLLFVLYYLLKGRFKLLSWTLLMIAVFLFLPSLYTGCSLNAQYLHDWLVLLRSTPATLLYSVKNCSLLSYFSWFFVARHEHCMIIEYNTIKKGLVPQVYYAWGLSCFAFFAVFFYDIFFVKDKRGQGSYLDYACLFVCGLLFNPLSYLNALVFLIVPYFFILRHLFYSPLNKKHILMISFFMFFSFVLTMIDNKVFFTDRLQFEPVLKLKPLMWAIVLVFISLFSLKGALKLKAQD